VILVSFLELIKQIELSFYLQASAASRLNQSKSSKRGAIPNATMQKLLRQVN
jgi:hypothetical protein